LKHETGGRLSALPPRLVALALLVAAACGDDPTPTTAGSTTSTDLSASTSQPITQPVTLRCETVGFTPNSEDAASEITATGLSCDEAEAFVRIAGERTSSGGPDRLDVSGFRCVRTGGEEDPLPMSRYECTNGNKKVTFVRS
jgi:hypothetical protein